MIKVTTLYQEDPAIVDAPACEVMDNGTLLIFNDREGMNVRTGFAVGTWVRFDMEG